MVSCHVVSHFRSSDRMKEVSPLHRESTDSLIGLAGWLLRNFRNINSSDPLGICGSMYRKWTSGLHTCIHSRYRSCLRGLKNDTPYRVTFRHVHTGIKNKVRVCLFKTKSLLQLSSPIWSEWCSHICLKQLGSLISSAAEFFENTLEGSGSLYTLVKCCVP